MVLVSQPASPALHPPVDDNRIECFHSVAQHLEHYHTGYRKKQIYQTAVLVLRMTQKTSNLRLHFERINVKAQSFKKKKKKTKKDKKTHCINK